MGDYHHTATVLAISLQNHHSRTLALASLAPGYHVSSAVTWQSQVRVDPQSVQGLCLAMFNPMSLMKAGSPHD
jgi:hypothetical protein